VAKSPAPVNLFYVLVVLVGVLFAITACAYGTMAYRAISPAVEPSARSSGLMGFLDRYGVQAMALELAALGAATCGAMMLDRYRSRDDASGDAR
jgi:hypothetical protein